MPNQTPRVTQAFLPVPRRATNTDKNVCATLAASCARMGLQSPLTAAYSPRPEPASLLAAGRRLAAAGCCFTAAFRLAAVCVTALPFFVAAVLFLALALFPAAPGIRAGQVGLFTGVQQVTSVPVVDQFGKPLGSEYNGHEVYETINGGNQAGINTTLKNGSYNDPVGFYTYTGKKVPNGGGAEQAWLAPGAPQATIGLPQQSSPQIAVTIAGFPLAPTAGSGSAVAIPGNRVVSYGILDGQYVLTVKWNAP